MDLSYDPAKNASNTTKHRVSFELAKELEWASALVDEDTRCDYRERRFQVLGLIRSRLHMLVFTPRAGCLHVISLRRASPRERARYDATQNPPRCSR